MRFIRPWIHKEEIGKEKKKENLKNSIILIWERQGCQVYLYFIFFFIFLATSLVIFCLAFYLKWSKDILCRKWRRRRTRNDQFGMVKRDGEETLEIGQRGNRVIERRLNWANGRLIWRNAVIRSSRRQRERTKKNKQREVQLARTRERKGQKRGGTANDCQARHASDTIPSAQACLTYIEIYIYAGNRIIRAWLDLTDFHFSFFTFRNKDISQQCIFF